VRLLIQTRGRRRRWRRRRRRRKRFKVIHGRSREI
jgi:hypothetical protein